MIGPLLLGIFLAHAAVDSPVGAPSVATRIQPPAAAQESPKQPWPPAGVFRIGSGVRSPEVIKEVRPVYTAEAKRAKIEGLVEMEVVIKADGTVGDVRVVRSLDRKFGLDEEAIKAVKNWRFKPATKDGVAVPVLVVIELTFTLAK